ncbi:MAG: GNAT family N-acetyltransferase [Clostridiales bacterium GWF2_36_10]|nr:MAG: GNAT family N-acetyltransferase [Clostridiales bacterium GWF2_36_10]HAN21883.1 GNAT family N-acetyltransferase [Clostridiales bacterium]
MLIREAVINDFKDIYILNKEGLGYDYPEEKTKAKLQIVLNISVDKIFVAEHDGKVIGYIHLSGYECTYSDSLKNILAIAALPEYCGKGIGKALLTAGENWAKKNGSCGIRLVSSSTRTDAHKFYAACGYTFRKEQKNFIKIFGG